jgi:hypothetical protein
VSHGFGGIHNFILFGKLFKKHLVYGIVGDDPIAAAEGQHGVDSNILQAPAQLAKTEHDGRGGNDSTFRLLKYPNFKDNASPRLLGKKTRAVCARFGEVEHTTPDLSVWPH